MSTGKKVTVASLAQTIPFEVLIAVAFINSNETLPPIEIEYNEGSLIVDKNPSSTVSYHVQGNEPIYGQKAVIQALSKSFPDKLYLRDRERLSDEWIDISLKDLSVRDFKKLNPALESLDSHLNFRSFIVGYGFTLGDIVVWGALRANPLLGSIIRSGTFINITRWYKFIELDSRFTAPVEDFTKDAAEKKKTSKGGKNSGKSGKNSNSNKKSNSANYSIGLVDAEDGKVVTRFPPEPSGYLHIGHAKAAILNQYFAQQYHGKLIVRFDDTNPSKEKMEFQQSIIEDLDLLGIKADRTTFSSDYFKEMYEYAIQLIKEGKAYTDNTPQEQMREERTNGIPSSKRDTPVDEVLQIFTEEMYNATPTGLKYCLRAKISYDNPNKALRDPVIYRTNLTPHHRTGTAWKIYPTYDFCVPIVDSLEGVTHALRTIEYRDRNPQYDWMLKALKLRKVHIWDFARVNFVRTLLSKRKLQWFVDKGLVTGWDDPRFPTVRGVRRRGMTIEGLWQFILAQGPSKNIINLEWNSIWATNKKYIDSISPRHVNVYAENPVKVHLSNGPEKPYEEKKPKHKKNPELGEKRVIYASDIIIDQDDAQSFKEGEEITFMDWGNAIIKSFKKDDKTGIIKEIEANLHLEGDFRKTDKKVTWLADTKDLVDVDLVDFDYLIVKDKLEEDDDVTDFITPKTEFHTSAVGDVNVASLKEGDVIQFERKGYFRLDKPASEGKPAVFFTVPDGKSVQRYGVKSKSTNKSA